MCEAAERNTRAVFELEMMAGAWVIDLGRIKQILTGADCRHEQEGETNEPDIPAAATTRD